MYMTDEEAAEHAKWVRALIRADEKNSALSIAVDLDRRQEAKRAHRERVNLPERDS